MIDRYLIKNLFGINGLNIAWYGVIIGFGVLLGVLIACREAKRQNLKSEIIFDFLFLALPIAIDLRNCEFITLYLNGNSIAATLQR